MNEEEALNTVTSSMKVAVLATALAHVVVLLENMSHALQKEADYIKAVMASTASLEKDDV